MADSSSQAVRHKEGLRFRVGLRVSGHFRFLFRLRVSGVSGLRPFGFLWRFRVSGGFGISGQGRFLLGSRGLRRPQGLLYFLNPEP